jgi:hypothetical protein
MSDNPLSAKTLMGHFEHTVSELNKLSEQIEALEKRKAALLRVKNDLADLIIAKTGNAPRLPQALLFDFAPNTKIGDAVEVILQEKGPLHTKDIFEILKNSKVSISSKHPRIVLINAIKRDTQERFKVLKDLRIDLVKGR